LATHLQSDVLPPGVEVERRSEPRTPYRSVAQLVLYPPGRHEHTLDVTVVDYSRSGIGIVYREGLMVGQQFVVREPHVTRGHTCLYTVVRSDKRGEGNYSIGLRAKEQLDDEWAPFTPPPAPGLDLPTKLLYLTFAIAGAATIVLTALVWRQHH
jgi:hypothetical protein